ncbi:PREDICTED: putative UPF0481 protein At3g02645 [Nelumbo nucifera]|uniref:Uncharacterized protein n=2 Tax=Nelumbo nucifera TaxID=4432 RepID=A0A822ZRN2_NELNU|nr:PREDICTED: putative UPF0481 protein At3g02645 [Nelumbo nucifera]DAD46181.1 TPA_asm: hypothetical protein HUJ06_004411 [Nelumbo nucifera]
MSSSWDSQKKPKKCKKMQTNIIDTSNSYLNNPNSDWLASIMNCEQKTTRSQNKPRMQKVPKIMRDVKDSNRIYDPMVVSVGPYHHGKPELEQVEKLKKRIAQKLVSRSNKRIEFLYNEVAKVAPRARDFYAEGSVEKLEDEKFLRIMFLDGCFVAYFIYCVVKDNLKELEINNDAIVSIGRDMFLLENQLPFLVLKALMSAIFPQTEWKRMVEEFVKKVNGIVSEVDEFNMGFYPVSQNEEMPKAFHLLDLLRAILLKNNCSEPGRDYYYLPKWMLYVCFASFRRLLYVCSALLKWLFYLCSGLFHVLHLTYNSLLMILLIAWPKLPILLSFLQEPCKRKFSLLKWAYRRSFGFLQWTLKKIYFKVMILVVLLWLLFISLFQFRRRRRRDKLWYSFPSVKELKAVGINFKMSESFSFRSVHFQPGLIYGNILLPPIVIDNSTQTRFLNLIAYERCCCDLSGFNITSYICFLDSLINHPDDVKELRVEGILFNNLRSDEEAANLINQMGRGLTDPDAYQTIKKDIHKYSKKRRRIWIVEILRTHFNSPWTTIAFFVTVFSATETYFTIFPRIRKIVIDYLSK